MKKFFACVLSLLSLNISAVLVWNEEIDVLSQGLLGEKYPKHRRMQLTAVIFRGLSEEFANYPLKKYAQKIDTYLAHHASYVKAECDFFLPEMCIQSDSWAPLIALFHAHNRPIINYIGG